MDFIGWLFGGWMVAVRGGTLWRDKLAGDKRGVKIDVEDTSTISSRCLDLLTSSDR